MRCDVNVSVRPVGAAQFGTKVEVKNMNSFSNMQKAIEFEIERQVALIRAGKADEVVQETRLWDENKQVGGVAGQAGQGQKLLLLLCRGYVRLHATLGFAAARGHQHVASPSFCMPILPARHQLLHPHRLQATHSTHASTPHLLHTTNAPILHIQPSKFSFDA
jgi:hypothetical protein